MALIEREAAKAKVAPDEYYHSNEVRAMLEDLPTVDPESLRPTGRWDFATDYTSQCTNCCEIQWIDHDKEPRYRPSCGARMDGGEGHEVR